VVLLDWSVTGHCGQWSVARSQCRRSYATVARVRGSSVRCRSDTSWSRRRRRLSSDHTESDERYRFVPVHSLKVKGRI